MKKLHLLLPLAFVTIAVAASETPNKRPGWLGLAFTYHTDASGDGKSTDLRGWLLIRDVIPETPAHRAGILPNDMVVAMQGKSFTTQDPRDVLRRFGEIKTGQNVALAILRNGKPKTITVKAAPMPDHVWQRWQKTLAMLAERESARH